MKEEWKDIKGYEGLYKVSNLGRVKSLDYHHIGKEGFLKPANKRGYLNVELFKNGIFKWHSVHRLVATTFIENPDNLPCVNHRDEVKTNNSASNLEWCTNQYNTRYSIAKKVGCYKDGKLIKVYDVIRDVKKDGFHHSNVVSCCKGKLKSYKGFEWQYL